jgi:hypothetical protein
MEPIMPDLKSALQSVLNEWNQPETATVQQQAHDQRPEGTRLFTRTNDVTRETFNYVRDNPRCKNREIRDALGAQGHKGSSVSSILSQMSRTGIINRDKDGTYWTNAREYSPVKLSKLRQARNTPTPTGRNPKAAKPKIVLTRKEATITPSPAPVAPAPRVVNSIDELISTLTIAQAKELFDKLRKMFA